MRRRVLGLLVAMLLMASPAFAVSFTSLYDPDPDILLNFGGSGGVLSHAYTHDLTVFPGSATNASTGATSPAAFVPANFTVTGGTLSLVLYDDADAGGEDFDATVDGLAAGNFTVVNGSTKGLPTVINIPISPALLADGEIAVTLTRNLNDMVFDRSSLTIEATPVDGPPPTNGVPFPSTLVLVGAALVGAALVGTRRARR